jgi:hypothetical protein
MKLDELQPHASVRGILPDALVTVVSVQWFGSEALELTYKTPAGKVANELLYRHDETRIELVEQGRPWSFDGDGSLFRLVSEAQRILCCQQNPIHAMRPAGCTRGSDLQVDHAAQWRLSSRGDRTGWADRRMECVDRGLGAAGHGGSARRTP